MDYYKQIYKRKSFHFFKNAEGLTDEEINKRLFELQQKENKKKVQIDAVNIKFWHSPFIKVKEW